ncbi:MAG: polyprenyl synthetase family protein [Oscillospiraceae bacterium]|nr:polyprenyl synthetase family protein [Oscillospiraceae bacterium]
MMNEEYRNRIEVFLRNAIECRDPRTKGLLDGMAYSLTAGGKRLRPVLVLEFCRISGGDPEKALPVAAAIEMLHTYSLIHDDLPAMDDDPLRRGKPTNHIVFGESNAILAGDALQAEAFYQIAASGLKESVRLACLQTLAEAAGLNGMCGGQYLDTNEPDSRDGKYIDTVNQMKTGALLSASCRMGVLCAEGTSAQLDAAARFGQAFGKAFQIRDDILDVTGNEAVLGKPVGSDQKDNKVNYMSLYGEKQCNEMVSVLMQEARNAVQDVFSDLSFLFALTDSMISRMN